MTDEPFYTHDLIESNVGDLKREIAALEAHRGRMVAIVSEDDGGIIAYALSEEFAAEIVRGLTYLKGSRTALWTLAHKLFDSLDPHTAENVGPYVQAQAPELTVEDRAEVVRIIRSLDPSNLGLES